MAIIHEKLYQASNFSQIDLSQYIRSVVDELKHSFGLHDRSIELNYQFQKIILGLDQAIPSGLIINELVSNSFKYGFPEQYKGHGKIRLGLKKNSNDLIEIIVHDNGVGLPQSIDYNQSKTLGLTLIRLLAEHQLKGKVEINRDQGTQFIVRFKAK